GRSTAAPPRSPRAREPRSRLGRRAAGRACSSGGRRASPRQARGAVRAPLAPRRTPRRRRALDVSALRSCRPRLVCPLLVGGGEGEERLVDPAPVWLRHRPDDAFAGEAGTLGD